MKKLFLSLLAAASISSKAQDCTYWAPMEKGAEFEITHYNAKDKVDGRNVYQVTDVTSEGGKEIAHFKSTGYDKKDKETATVEFDMFCENGMFYMEMTQFVSSEQLASMEGMEMTIEADDLAFPNELTVGQTLPDGSVTIQAKVEGMPGGIGGMTMTVTMTDRKVEAIETIEVNGTSVECYKMTYNSNLNMTMMNKTYPNIVWCAPNLGAVKTETYKENGKLIGYSLMTKMP